MYVKHQRVIDVMDFNDVSVPKLRPLGSCDLRQRQLRNLGYGVNPVCLKQLYEAVKKEGTGRRFVANVISHFMPDVGAESIWQVDESEEQLDLLGTVENPSDMPKIDF